MKVPKFIKLAITISIHILFWIAVYFFYTYFLGYGSLNTAYVNRFAGFLMPVTITTSYLFYFYLIPKFLLENKRGLFVLYTVYTLIISSFFVITSILYGYFLLHNYHNENTPPLTKTILPIYLSVYFIVFTVIVIALIINNFESVSKNEELKTKFLSAQLKFKEQELDFLKMQIHPHFLFNSLNTIYGYALQQKDEAPEMILKLSNLLDYILYQIKKPKVLLQNEINHLKDYVALEKMRFRDSLSVVFEDNSSSKNIEIAPMLLIPFVENSFKHGAIINGKLFVKIIINENDEELSFVVENSVNKNQIITKGIGLENIKKRLHLLYPDAHELAIESTDTFYKTTLILKTNKFIPIKNEF